VCGGEGIREHHPSSTPCRFSFSLSRSHSLSHSLSLSLTLSLSLPLSYSHSHSFSLSLSLSLSHNLSLSLTLNLSLSLPLSLYHSHTDALTLVSHDGGRARTRLGRDHPLTVPVLSRKKVFARVSRQQSGPQKRFAITNIIKLRTKLR